MRRFQSALLKYRNNFLPLVFYLYICTKQPERDRNNMHLVEINIHKIIELCKRFHVRKLWVFGSILTDRFNDESDVDLCVDFDKSKISLLDYADNFFDFQYALEDLFGRDVDLTEDSAVRNRYFREELNEKRKLIYG